MSVRGSFRLLIHLMYTKTLPATPSVCKSQNTNQCIYCFFLCSFVQQINGVCLSPTNTKQKRPHPEMKRTKSQGTRKIQKAQSSASMDDTNFGGALGYLLFCLVVIPKWRVTCFVNRT